MDTTNVSSCLYFEINKPVSIAQFIGLLDSSTLGNRRPVDDLNCIEAMLNNSNLVISAWQGGELVGIARSVTDFHYVAYLSDLAVNHSYQRQGIGKKLLSLTQAQLGSNCKVILIAAPDVNNYYEPLGFKHNSRCWVLKPEV